ncbi:MAG: NAD(P)-dependent glycerol-3-phosphate dehydrogenase [Chloroflexi bacterium]|nr:MAG: NAD(P)-dependent glycerol-3-phosphate dehydrogenase [Chloroflexota bacterium]
MTAIAVVGAGSWGTALAQTLAVAGREVRLWGRDPAVVRQIADWRRNPAYMPGLQLHPDIAATDELSQALRGARVVILAVPTHGLRVTAQRCIASLEAESVVVSAAKGFEAGTGATMSRVLAEVLGTGSEARVAALSGPNIAPEIARGLPAATVVASGDPATAAVVRDCCTGSQLRVYSNDDLTGVEYGGALKNVVAIAAGIGDGAGAGDNGKAAVITRGLAEMARLGVRAGARPLTFAGLTGLGDCVVTCMSPHSRNRRLGEAIGHGKTLVEATAGMFMVAEGVNAAAAARSLAAQYGVEMPIVNEVCAVLFDGKPVAQAVADLMRRGARDELDEFGLTPFGGALAP